MSVTELVTFPTTVSREDVISQQSVQWEKMIVPAPGFQHGVSGFGIEDPKVLHWFVTWDKLASHEALTKKPEYGPFIQSVLQFSGPPQLRHVAGLHSDAVFSSPVVELLTCHLSADTDKDEWVKGLDVFKDVLERTGQGKGWRALSAGWGVENDRIFTVMIGWDSKEAHLDWKKNADQDEVMRALGMFRSGLENIELVHVKIEGSYHGK